MLPTENEINRLKKKLRREPDTTKKDEIYRRIRALKEESAGNIQLYRGTAEVNENSLIIKAKRYLEKARDYLK